MRKILFATIVVLVGYSCAESEKKKPNKIIAIEQPEVTVDTIVITDKVKYINSYLEISALNKEWPLAAAKDEINWQRDTFTQRYSRRYYPLDTLIEGRPVFADSLGAQFFFYFPYNKCWMLNAEFPDSALMASLKQRGLDEFELKLEKKGNEWLTHSGFSFANNNFLAIITREDYYRFGYEYGDTDSWDLTKLIFSKSPWENNSSIYQFKWVGDDPMIELKKDWEIRHKAQLYKGWLAAYNQFKKDTSKSALFIPKPIAIDNAKTLIYKEHQGSSALRAYLIDQYKLIDTVCEINYITHITSESRYDEGMMESLLTTNADGEIRVSQNYSNGFKLEVKTRNDTLIIPEVQSIKEIFSSNISHRKHYQSYNMRLMEKGENIVVDFTLPIADIKYLMVLLEFLYDDTYIIDSPQKLIEYRSAMPIDPESGMEGGGCRIDVRSNTITFEDIIGGC